MTDDMPDNLSEQDANRLPRRDDGVERDYELQGVVGLVDRGLEGAGLTVNVGGTIMSGLLVSQTRWHDLLIEKHGQTGGLLEVLLRGFRDALSRADEEPNPDYLSYRFLHLTDGRILAGERMVGGQFLWRVRISEVSAWTFQQWPGGRLE
jgi:hypothetical protein